VQSVTTAVEARRDLPTGEDRTGFDVSESTAWRVVATAAVLTFVVCVIGIGSKSFWEDESYTWSLVARDWGDFLRVVRDAESQNFLYSIFMFGWVRIADSEAFLRLPSAVFAALSVPAAYLAGRALFDRRAGVLAAVLLAVNANTVEFGQEARAYTFAILLLLLSLYGFVSMVQQPERATMLAWVVPSCLVVYTHPYAIFVVAAEVVSLFVLRPSREIWRRAVTGTVLVVVSAVPMVALLLSQHSGKVPVGLGSLGELVRTATGVFGKGGVLLVLAWLALLVWAVFVTTREWGSSTAPARWRMIVPWSTLVVVCTLVVLTGVYRQVLTQRHLLIGLPGLVLVGAFALLRLPSRRWFVGATAVILALSVYGTVKWQTGRPRPDWRAAAHHVLDNARPGDAVTFFDDQGRVPFEFYVRDDDRRDLLVPAFPAGPWGSFGTGDQKDLLPDAGESAALDESFRRIWVVMRTSIYEEQHLEDHPMVVRDADPGLLFPSHELADHREFPAEVDVFLYERPDAIGGGAEPVAPS
jgi:mannosyltransferase